MLNRLISVRDVLIVGAIVLVGWFVVDVYTTAHNALAADSATRRGIEQLFQSFQGARQ
jgi:hypothetical protein